jgi:hypothetical protein
MDAVEFLAGTVADLPKTRSETYQSLMDRLFCEYQAEIRRISTTHSLEAAICRQVSKIEPLSDALREVIALLVADDRDAAYSRLDAALSAMRAHLSMLMPRGDTSRLLDPMYRFRTDPPNPCSKGDVFHIPFEYRNKVKPMRYSVAGLPSLYLGGSTHVCQRELGQDLNTIAVSRFHAVQDSGLRVMNFGFRPRMLGSYVKGMPHLFEGDTDETMMILGNVACWPLIAACSVRVPDRNAPDRPEYLVPQLVLEWVANTHDFHGIRYFSTHYSEYPENPKTYMNYVFPSRSIAASGYCADLCRFFELTDPISWAEAKAANSARVGRPLYKMRGVLDADLEAEFGRAEDGLLGLPVGSLTPKVC